MKITAFENRELENKVKLDFKERYQQWFKTLCAFANTDGGVMNVGVKDDMEIVGYSQQEIDLLKRQIEKICQNHSKPFLKCKFEEVQFEDDLFYLRICVQKRTMPTWYIDDKTSPLLYVRHEGMTELATVEEQCQLISEANLYEYDRVETGIRYDESSFEDLEEEYRGSHNNENLTQKKMISFGLMTEKGYLTVAGVLFSDNSLSKNANVTCTTWPSLNKGSDDYIDSKTYTGSLMFLLHSAISYIQSVSHYYFGGNKKGLYRKDTGSFNLVSLREGLVNALAHRDYKIDGNEIAINCYPDRIEIVSPGSMLQSKADLVRAMIDIDRFPSIRRNKTICAIFEKCGLMENKGSGFEKIVEDYKNLGQEYAPLISANRISFTIILKNKKYQYNGTLSKNNVQQVTFGKTSNSPMFLSRQNLFSGNPKYEMIEKIIRQNSQVSIEEIAKSVGLTKDGVKYDIRKMKDACLIRRGKEGYEVVNDIDRPADFNSLDKETQIKAINWCLDNFVPSKTELEDRSSFELKDDLEENASLYLTNGQFKGAMMLAGFEASDIEQLNWTFKISKSTKAFLK